MRRVSIYRTPEGRAAVLALYERNLARLPFDVDSRVVDTGVGATHLLVAGPEAAPPLVVVHGANGSAVAMAQALGRLTATNRCYFVDVPGEPNRSCEVRLSKSDDSLAQWMAEVLAQLGLERVALLGMSGGGYVVLKCCAVMPARVTRVVLLVPEGLARPRLSTFVTKVLWPLVRYRRSPTAANARRLAATLAAMPESGIAEAIVEHMEVMRHVASPANLGPPFSKRALAGLEAPVLLVAGGRDVVFPAEPSLKRARAVIPRLESAILLPHAGHIHPDIVGAPVVEHVLAFLARSE